MQRVEQSFVSPLVFRLTMLPMDGLGSEEGQRHGAESEPASVRHRKRKLPEQYQLRKTAGPHGISKPSNKDKACD